jgi:formate dehydrogenase subunit gamma
MAARSVNLMSAYMSAQPFDRAALDAILAVHGSKPDGLLPLLHDVQHAFGHIPKASVDAISRHLHLSRAEVHGVITYYSHFRSEPAGRVLIQMCRAEACQARGSTALIGYAEDLLDCPMSSTRPDGAVTLEPVYCLGQCATGPNIQIDERIFGRVDARRLRLLVEQMAANTLVPSVVS